MLLKLLNQLNQCVLVLLVDLYLDLLLGAIITMCFFENKRNSIVFNEVFTIALIIKSLFMRYFNNVFKNLIFWILNIGRHVSSTLLSRGAF